MDKKTLFLGGILLFIILVVVSLGLSVHAQAWNDNNGMTITTANSDTVCFGVKLNFTNFTNDINVTAFVQENGSANTRLYVFNGSYNPNAAASCNFSNGTNPTLTFLKNVSFSGATATIPGGVVAHNGEVWSFLYDAQGASRSNRYSTTPAMPILGNTTKVTWLCSFYTTCQTTNNFGGQAVSFSDLAAGGGGSPTLNLTVKVNDTRTGSFIQGFNWNYTTTNGSDTSAKSGFCNTAAGCSITNFSGTINTTVFNVSNNTYFTPYDSPRLNTVYNATAGLNLTFNTFQSSINITNITNILNGSLLNFCIIIGNSTTSQTQCSGGNTSITVYQVIGNLNYNITNISGGTYFNITGSINNFNSSMALLYNTTEQAFLNISAYQLFTNKTLSSFNVTNNSYTNSSPVNNYSSIPANTGNNTLLINVPGNYSMIITCNALGLQTTSCNATGIYDELFNIGAKNMSGGVINNFTININNTLNVSGQSTTNGTAIIPVLQGYTYNFTFSANNYSTTSVFLPANASNNYYNFSVIQWNYFILAFYNETTNALLSSTTNITINLISASYAINLTNTGPYLNISVPVPDSYTIQYWIDPLVPRNYYVTLSPSSYSNIALYTLDAFISTTYLPVITDQNTQPIGGAIVQLLRAYIVNNNYVYYTVEMETTDTNGQAVFRVVPNTINYKLLITNNGATLTTAPTKFTGSTNTYTLSNTVSSMTSIIAIPGVTKSLTFNNATGTYVFTWVDTSNIITSGCMTVNQAKGTSNYAIYNQCLSASTGSLTYTVNDTNNTRYVGTASLTTNTQYSNYGFGPVTADYTNSANVFGTLGLLILLMVLITVGLMANESGSDGMILMSIIMMVFLGVIGIIAYSWEAFIGVIIFGGIIIYKTRR